MLRSNAVRHSFSRYAICIAGMRHAKRHTQHMPTRHQTAPQGPPPTLHRFQAIAASVRILVPPASRTRCGSDNRHDSAAAAVLGKGRRDTPAGGTGRPATHGRQGKRSTPFEAWEASSRFDAAEGIEPAHATVVLGAHGPQRRTRRVRRRLAAAVKGGRVGDHNGLLRV